MILFIGDSSNLKKETIELISPQQISSLNDFIDQRQNLNLSVIVVFFRNLEEPIGLLKEQLHKYEQVIFVHYQLPALHLQKIINELHPFRVLNNPDDKILQHSIQEAMEQSSLIKQNQELVHLINEQNHELKKLSEDLETRVQKRQIYLTNARKKLLTSNSRVEALHQALIAIHKANSISELESLLNQALDQAFDLSWVRILFHQQDFFEKQTEMNRFQFELFSSPLFKDREHLGQIYFARTKGKAFKKDEHNFLIQVSDAVGLAIDRLKHFNQTENLKQQWETTFDAISAPLSLISQDYRILRCNQSYAKQTSQPIKEIIGKVCYETLFKRTSPCPKCHLGKSFRLAPKKTVSQKMHTFSVSSQKLDLSLDQKPTYAVIYQDISDQLKLERQVIESAKMAEIGTIGSSIAHELNNPLGGMISFLQLIKSDLNGSEAYYEDIVEMEKGAEKCKNIVQDLLNFSRVPQFDDLQKVSLKEIIDQAIKLTELQTRSKGIELIVKYPISSPQVLGQKNLLTQAVRHLLQHSNQSISQSLQKGVGQGKIFISLEEQNDFHKIQIKTHKEENITEQNISPDSAISLTVTNQIVNEHSGSLEVFAGPEDSIHFSISIPNFNS